MPSIEWHYSDARLIIPIAVFAASHSTNASELVRTDGLIDTGATRSGIRSDIARRLGLRSESQRRIETANGPLFAREYLVRFGLFAGDFGGGEADQNNQYPIVLDRHFFTFELAAGFTYPVLIGMDVISQCDLHVLRDGTAQIDLP